MTDLNCVFQPIKELQFKSFIEGIIIEEEILNPEKVNQNLLSTDIFHPTLIFVTTRIGLDKIEKKFKEAFVQLIQCQFFTGLLGYFDVAGEKDKALYIIGIQGKYLLFLDPHYVQVSFI